MKISATLPVRHIVLLLIAALGAGQALATTYELRVPAKGVQSPLTNPVIGDVPGWSVVFGAQPIQIPTPSSNSTGLFSYVSSLPAVASVSGSQISFGGVGTTTITATQAPDARHNAGTVSFAVTVLGASPTLTGFSNVAKTYGDGNFALTPPSTPSSGTISYSSNNPSVATVSGSTVQVVGAGSATIVATQAAGGNYAASSTSATLTVSKAAPVVQSWSIAGKQVGSGTFTLTPPTSTSNEPFSYSSSNTGVASISGTTVTLVSEGTATITASQAANGNYLASTKSAVLAVSPVPLPSGYFTYNGLTWTPRSSGVHSYASALSYCAGSFNGSTGWRLQTLAEFVPARNANLLTGVNVNAWNKMNNGQYTYSQTVPGTGTGYTHPDGNITFSVYCVK